jgi:hypothetical protein
MSKTQANKQVAIVVNLIAATASDCPLENIGQALAWHVKSRWSEGFPAVAVDRASAVIRGLDGNNAVSLDDVVLDGDARAALKRGIRANLPTWAELAERKIGERNFLIVAQSLKAGLAAFQSLESLASPEVSTRATLPEQRRERGTYLFEFRQQEA